MKATQAKQEYEGQRALADILFNSIGDGALTTDEFGRITRINPTAQTILGYSEEEILGKWLPKMLIAYNEEGHPVPLTDRPVTRAFMTGQIVSERLWYRNKDGSMVPVAVTISPIIVQGQPNGCIEVFRDITKDYEIDKMKSDFISLASHQLRTPLSTVKTYSHMLVEGYMGQLNDAQTESLNTIISASNRMNETVSTLLNISRIEGGVITLHHKIIELGALCDDIIHDHRLVAKEKNLDIICHKPKQAIKIRNDSVLLKEVFANLINNSIKYTPEHGSIDVRIYTKDDQAMISIKDTGVGIPETSQDYVFSKFFRAANVASQETSGMGLGLYLTKSIIHEMNGRIWFKSSEGQGTTFYVALPLVTSKQPVKKPATNKR